MEKRGWIEIQSQQNLKQFNIVMKHKVFQLEVHVYTRYCTWEQNTRNQIKC